jgi:hypothetical protein
VNIWILLSRTFPPFFSFKACVYTNSSPRSTNILHAHIAHQHYARTNNYAPYISHIQHVLIVHHQYSMCTASALLLCMHPSILHDIHIHCTHITLPYYMCSTSSTPFIALIFNAHISHTNILCASQLCTAQCKKISTYTLRTNT